MRAELENCLEDAMNRYRQRQVRDSLRAPSTFIERFDRLVDSTIIPALESVRSVLRGHSHRSQVRYVWQMEAQAVLEVFSERGGARRAISFTALPEREYVKVLGSGLGNFQVYKLEQLTNQAIEDLAVEELTSLFEWL
jgi:hypothetical protein